MYASWRSIDFGYDKSLNQMGNGQYTIQQHTYPHLAMIKFWIKWVNGTILITSQDACINFVPCVCSKIFRFGVCILSSWPSFRRKNHVCMFNLLNEDVLVKILGLHSSKNSVLLLIYPLISVVAAGYFSGWYYNGLSWIKWGLLVNNLIT